MVLIEKIKRQKKINLEYYKTAKQELKNDDDEKEYEKKSNTDCNEYGQELFEYFCNNRTAHSVEIKEFEKLSNKLQKELFYDDANGNKLSFVPIFILFSYLKKITFSESRIDQIDKSKNYINAAFECIKTMTSTYDRRELKQITFQSKTRNRSKENPDLKRLETKFNEKFKENGLAWNIEYEFQDKKHTIILRHQMEANIQELKDMHEEKMRVMGDEITKLKMEVAKLNSQSKLLQTKYPKIYKKIALELDESVNKQKIVQVMKARQRSSQMNLINSNTEMADFGL